MDKIKERIYELQDEYKSIISNINYTNKKLGEFEKRRIELEAIITELYKFIGGEHDGTES